MPRGLRPLPEIPCCLGAVQKLDGCKIQGEFDNGDGGEEESEEREWRNKERGEVRWHLRSSRTWLSETSRPVYEMSQTHADSALDEQRQVRNPRIDHA